MATKPKSEQKQDARAKPYEYEHKGEFNEDWTTHTDYTSTFDSYEAMLVGLVYDSVSKSVDGSKITDSYATTLAIERSSRVMGKLPEGTTEAAAKGDAGKGAFLDILRQKWIYPNANAQHPFMIKLRNWQLYSSVYGYMPMFYDWNVSPSGYVGPDCWLWNPRLLVPQQGRISISDMEYLTAITHMSPKVIQDIIDNPNKNDGWDREALKALLEIAKDKKTDQDTEEQTEVERTRTNQSLRKGIKVATRYEAGPDGEWISFCPDHSYVEIRRLKNPHKNGKIPFVVKYSQPLFDSFYGLGDFQRAKPLQYARDGLTNFYFKGIKMNLIPPLVVNAHGVLKHTIDYREAAVMQETIPNSIRTLDTSTAGLNTYQSAQSNLTGSLLALYGSQNAAIPGAESLNPSQGKTPAAIDFYQEKEATRDGQERMHMENAIEQLTDGFNELVVNIGTEEIPISLFREDIEAIKKAGLVDVLDMFKNFTPDSTGVSGELKIKPSVLKGVSARFNIKPGSTSKTSKEEQLNAIERLLGVVAKFQNVLQEDPNIEVNFGALLSTYETLSEIKGASEFIKIKEGPSKREQELEQQVQQLSQQNQQMEMQMAQKAMQHEGQLLKATQSNLAPPAMNVGGNNFNNPEIAQLAQEFSPSPEQQL